MFFTFFFLNPDQSWRLFLSESQFQQVFHYDPGKKLVVLFPAFALKTSLIFLVVTYWQKIIAFNARSSFMTMQHRNILKFFYHLEDSNWLFSHRFLYRASPTTWKFLNNPGYFFQLFFFHSLSPKKFYLSNFKKIACDLNKKIRYYNLK